MSWERVVLSPSDLGVAWAQGSSAVFQSLIDRCAASWPLLARGLEALSQASRRTLLVGSARVPVVLLHHPARWENVVASPDPAKRCALCVRELPPEERGLAVGRDLVALPNPAPILRNHVVLAHREHRPQELRPSLEDLAWLAERLDEQTVILYNGFSSGASSPYHLHLQAGLLSDLPLPSYPLPPPSTPVPGGRAEPARVGARRFLWLHIDGPDAIPEALRWALDSLDPQQEFPLNLILWRQGEGLRAALFARATHRPSCYFRPEPERIVISPGSVEMAGLVVLPRLLDWERLGEAEIEAVYEEVVSWPWRAWP